MYTVSVEEAVKKRKAIQYTSVLIIMGIYFPLMFAGFNIISIYHLPEWMMALAVLVPIIIAFAIGLSIDERRAMKWQLWAFSNVRNVHILKQYCEQYRLLAGYWGRMFRRSPFDAEWAALQYRFDTPDEQADDNTLPESVRIERSKWKLIANSPMIMIVFLSPFLVMGLYYGSGAMGGFIVLMVIAIIFMSLRSFLALVDSRVCLVIDDNGIQMGGDKYFAWGDIKNERIEVVRTGFRQAPEKICIPDVRLCTV